jgi:hypothetical protein
MKRSVLVLALALAGVLVLWAQRSNYPGYLPYELKALFPKETGPGQYQYVDPREIQALSEQGWELVSVVPHVYRNEERGNSPNIRPVVTQVYPAYFFQRLRAIR